MIDDVLTDASRRMDKSVETAKHEFTTIRTGRASAALLDRIQVSAYGTKMPVNQLATISVPEARLITVLDLAALSVGAVPGVGGDREAPLAQAGTEVG